VDDPETDLLPSTHRSVSLLSSGGAGQAPPMWPKSCYAE
jgi:hypothetical protein